MCLGDTAVDMSAQKEVPMGMNHMTVVPENFELSFEDEDDE